MRLTALTTWLWQHLPWTARQLLLWLGNAHFLVGAVAIVDDGAGRILVARHTYRHRAPWALPGGWVRRGEDPARTVVREIREETTLETEITGMLTMVVDSPVHLTAVYRARVASGTFRPSHEVSAVRFIEPGDWPDGLREDHRRLIAAFATRPTLLA
ncbi:MAG TPA: NUDIX domain-containing protein [bacterium]|nr:NUDIX domain-containing protein [bacterium]